MVATYHGSITNGLDGAGIFSSADTDLTGQAFSGGFRYDTALGLTQVNGTNHELLGGSSFGYATPILGAWITINGHTYNFLADSGAIVTLNSGTAVSHLAFHDNGNGGDLLNLALSPIITPVDFATPFSATLPVGFPGGVAQVTPSSMLGTPNTVLGLNVVDVTVSEAPSASAVPEPSTWALMITGLFGTGAALRALRRRTSKSDERVPA